MDKGGKLEGGGLRLEIWRIEKTFLFVCLFHFWVILGTECISNPAQVTKTSIFSFLKNENNRQKYKKKWSEDYSDYYQYFLFIHT